MSAKRIPRPTEKALAMVEVVNKGKRKATKAVPDTGTGSMTKKRRQGNSPANDLDADEEMEVSTNMTRDNSPHMSVENGPNAGDGTNADKVKEPSVENGSDIGDKTDTDKVKELSDVELGMSLS